jgi:hydroxypyruvate reductase
MREHLEAIFRAGLAAADPAAAVREHVRLEGELLRAAGEAWDLSKRRVLLAAAGKGAAPMAREFLDRLGPRVADAVVVVKTGHGLELPRGRLLEAAHPVPDEAGVRASEAVLDLAGKAGPDDLFLLALTGGASALLPAPAAGLGLEDLQRTTEALLAAGADIAEVNAVRSHASRIGGGGLARAAAPASMLGLLVSDVVGDDASVIGSGPLSPDRSTFSQCLDVVRRYGLEERLPAAVLERLRRGEAGDVPETPKPGDAVFAAVRQQIVASNAAALEAAASKARELGYAPFILTSRLTGEAREAARFFAAVAREAAERGRPVAPPACLLMGGETTVTVRGSGLGGRNQEMALAASVALDSRPGAGMLFAGTDGTDGPTDAAGAFAFPDTASRAREAGMDPMRYLEDNDSHHFFDRLGDLLRTGPTRTNVMDMAIALTAGGGA